MKGYYSILAVGVLSWPLQVQMQPYMSNEGQLSVRDNTEVSSYFDFENQSTGQVLNDGEFYFYGNYRNDGVLNIDEVWEYVVSYTITQSDINNGGVYNQAFVTGESSTGDTFETEYSVDPSPLNPSDPNYDAAKSDYTFTLLKSRTLLITNPNIYQRVKNN